jgi:dCTP deaminase
VVGPIREYASDKYQHNRDIQPSLLYKELNPEAARKSPQRTFAFEPH